MQTYGPLFAQVYNQQWSGFARQVAPALLGFYQVSEPGQARLPVLDLCCGTGQLAVAFLEQGYDVTGLDLSAHMLAYAAGNAASYVDAGRARFVQGDATSFAFGQRFGLVVSTFDALNHLDDLDALRGCFASVARVLAPGGLFVFDLNTRLGLLRWNSINIIDTADHMIVNRGIYDGHGDKAYTRLSGFVRAEDGRYERFEETMFNTAFAVDDVLAALAEAGWPGAYAARLSDLATPLAEPETEGRAFFVARS
jgi:SAM-dependent methyltransferase